MVIDKTEFVDEKEIEEWVFSNLRGFFGDAVVLGKHKIYTNEGKGGIPDGFALDLNGQSWKIIECELLSHGVWDHIAEQVVRFVVAAQNPNTKILIRDKFIDRIEELNSVDRTCKGLGIPRHRLTHAIESIIFSNSPEIALFIDETNNDLVDFSKTINNPIQIYRVNKYSVNGSVEYESPDDVKPVFETTAEEIQESTGNKAKALDLLGGGHLIDSIRRVQIFELENESRDKVSLKYSKYYESFGFWFGITPKTVTEIYLKIGVNYVVFILGEEGVIKLPIDVLRDYLERALTTKKPDGSISHYHIYFKGFPEPELYINKTEKGWDCKDFAIEYPD